LGEGVNRQLANEKGVGPCNQFPTGVEKGIITKGGKGKTTVKCFTQNLRFQREGMGKTRRWSGTQEVGAKPRNVWGPRGTVWDMNMKNVTRVLKEKRM